MSTVGVQYEYLHHHHYDEGDEAEDGQLPQHFGSEALEEGRLGHHLWFEWMRLKGDEF